MTCDVQDVQEILYRADAAGVNLSLSDSGKILVAGPPGAVAAIRPLLVANKPAIVAHLAGSVRLWQEIIEQAAQAVSGAAGPAIMWLIDLMVCPGRLEAACGEREALLDRPRGERQIRKGYFVANEPRWWPMRATARQVWAALIGSAPGSVERKKAVAVAEWFWRLWRGEKVEDGAAIGWRGGGNF